MKTTLFFTFTFLFLLISQTGFSQTGNLFGKIKDSNSQEEIGGAKISLSTSQTFYSDFEGNFSLQNLPTGKYTLTIESLGYANNITKEIEIKEDENLMLDFYIQESSLENTPITNPVASTQN